MIPEVSFTNLLGVAAVAFAAPLLLGLAPRIRVPSAVVEIAAGVVIGPAVLGWVEPDLPVGVLSLVGLAFLLFLAGLEVEPRAIRASASSALAGYGLSFALAVGASLGLDAAGLVETPLLVAVILSATGLGVILPVLKDAGEATSPFGQLVIGAGSVADLGSVVLLSLLFSREPSGRAGAAVVLVVFALLAAVAALALARADRSMRLRMILERLQDTTAQLRVRGAVLLLIGFVVAAEQLGLEAILGAFLAGAILAAVDRGATMSHPHFRLKLEAMGFGFFIPAFFVATGLRFDLGALLESPSAWIRVPVFVGALLAVRGVPALLYRRAIGPRRTAAAALLQATSLSFVVAASEIGRDLGMLSAETATGLVAAGLLSVLLFPSGAIALLGTDAGDATDASKGGTPPRAAEPSPPATPAPR